MKHVSEYSLLESEDNLLKDLGVLGINDERIKIILAFTHKNAHMRTPDDDPRMKIVVDTSEYDITDKEIIKKLKKGSFIVRPLGYAKEKEDADPTGKVMDRHGPVMAILKEYFWAFAEPTLDGIMKALLKRTNDPDQGDVICSLIVDKQERIRWRKVPKLRLEKNYLV